MNAKDRHPLLNSVPPQVEEFLLEPPLAGTGVHQWFYKAARRTCRYLEETDQNELLAWAVRNCGRSPGPQEIEKTVHKVRTQYDAGLEFTGGSAWPEPNYEFVNQLVSGGPTIAEVRNASPVWPLSDDPLYWLNILFAQGNPLLCLAKEVWKDTGTGREVVRYWSTRSKAAWNKQGCPTHGLIIPNIACSYSGLSQEGKRAFRREDLIARSPHADLGARLGYYLGMRHRSPRRVCGWGVDRQDRAQAARPPSRR